MDKVLVQITSLTKSRIIYWFLCAVFVICIAYVLSRKPLTRNDIVYQNSVVLYEAILAYQEQFDKVPSDLMDLVRAGHISCLPTNPYTNQEMRLVRMDECSYGNLTLISGEREIFLNNKLIDKHIEFVMFSYGDPSIPYNYTVPIKYSAPSDVNIDQNIIDKIVFTDGFLGSAGPKYSVGYTEKSLTLREAMIASGYSFPLTLKISQ